MLPFDYRSGLAMATNDDMRESIQSLEAKFDGLEKKVDQLSTKIDVSELAIKGDLVAFKDEIIKNFRILADDAKDSAKNAAEGYQATLDRIERNLPMPDRLLPGSVPRDHRDGKLTSANRLHCFGIRDIT